MAKPEKIKEAIEAQKQAQQSVRDRLKELKELQAALEAQQRVPGSLARNAHDIEKSSARLTTLAAASQSSPEFMDYERALSALLAAFELFSDSLGASDLSGEFWANAKPEDLDKFRTKLRDARANLGN